MSQTNRKASNGQFTCISQREWQMRSNIMVQTSFFWKKIIKNLEKNIDHEDDIEDHE